VTDGSPAMFGSKNGLVEKFNGKKPGSTIHNFD
jgi:hypothetical protein